MTIHNTCFHGEIGKISIMLVENKGLKLSGAMIKIEICGQNIQQ